MKIQNFIKIDTVYTRSINIERDIDSESIVKAYIPTSRTLLTLNRVIDTFHINNISRSWALIGPYGSGKSSFAVFISHLMGDPQEASTKSAFKILSSTDENISAKIHNHTQGTKGYLPVVLTGSPEPFADRFIDCLRDSAIKFWEKKRGPTPKIVKNLKETTATTNITPSKILSLVKELQTTVARGGGKGILIIFDELGKFLEYEARHNSVNDIYLLQLLAEQANKGEEANLLIFALLHQGFENYVRGLGESLRNEWAKIHGRFENIPFLETTEQTLRVMAKAFGNKLDDNRKKNIKNNCHKIVKILSKERALPGTLDQNDATELFSTTYPLHPISALILPLLCQKMAQNERTLFSYLGSKEPYGFYDSIEKIDTMGEWVAPWEIYEYFILNQPAVLSDPTTHRRWAEVVTALERLGDAPSNQIKILKTIGLLNIIGAQGGLKASKRIIHLCFSDDSSTSDALHLLKEKSLINYRKYSSEYRVWQGSDFDLEAAIQEELNQIGHFNLPEEINKRETLQPIVARRHTIRTGALRYFLPLFVDVSSYKKEEPCANKERMIFFLMETFDDVEIFKKEIKSYFSNLNIVAISPNGGQLRKAVGEVIALERIQINRQELNSDPIAKREFKDRYEVAKTLEDNLLWSFFESPEICQWYWKSENLKINSKIQLQNEISHIADKLYHSAPILKNELINRDKPSAQAISARNKLVSALLNHADKEDLGIEKYPAEKGLYRALFLATGLHRKINENWKIAPPDTENPSSREYNLEPAWNRIKFFLDITEEHPKSFYELEAELHAPPYGIKLGVLPILFFSIFLCYKDELALYENGVYIPYITEHHIERFLKRPDVFEVQRIEIKGIRASLLQEYTKVLYGDNANTKNLISIAKPLAKFIFELEDYTKNTSRISDTAQNLLKAFNVSKSPYELLFSRLPTACGFQTIDPKETNIQKIDGFSSTLINVIRELRDAYKNMTFEFQIAIEKSLLPDSKKDLNLSELRGKIKARYEDLISYTADIRGLRPFIEHLADGKCDDETWMGRLLLFLGNKPPKKWTDIIRDGAMARLIELSRRLIDLNVLQSHYLSKKTSYKGEYDVFLLKSMRYGEKYHSEIVTIDEARKKYIYRASVKVRKILNELNDDGLRLAVMAELVDELLKKREKNKISNRLCKQKVINE